MGCLRLEIAERIVLDRGPMDEMCRVLGPERAERLIGGAMEELAVWLARAEPLLRRGERAELARLSRRIAAVAARLGMPLLARVAAEAEGLCPDGDAAALAAVSGRMVRVGERSLAAVWELEGTGG